MPNPFVLKSTAGLARFQKVATIAVLVGLVSAGFYFATLAHHYSSVTVPNCYAVWWVADMVIEHLESNGGRWPTTWDDLQDDYDACVRRSGAAWKFDELQERVTVDWNANPSELARSSAETEGPPFLVIKVRNNVNVYWGHQEPNRKILEYLKFHHATMRTLDSSIQSH